MNDASDPGKERRRIAHLPPRFFPIKRRAHIGPLIGNTLARRQIAHAELVAVVHDGRAGSAVEHLESGEHILRVAGERLGHAHRWTIVAGVCAARVEPPDDGLLFFSGERINCNGIMIAQKRDPLTMRRYVARLRLTVRAARDGSKRLVVAGE